MILEYDKVSNKQNKYKAQGGKGTNKGGVL